MICQTVLPSGWTILCIHQQYLKIPFALQDMVLSVFMIFNSSSGCEVVFHYDFHLHSPNVQWWWAVFFMYLMTNCIFSLVKFPSHFLKAGCLFCTWIVGVCIIKIWDLHIRYTFEISFFWSWLALSFLFIRVFRQHNFLNLITCHIWLVPSRDLSSLNFQSLGIFI